MKSLTKHRAHAVGDVVIYSSHAFQARFWITAVNGTDFTGVRLLPGTFNQDTSKGAVILPLSGIIETLRTAA